MSVVRNLAPKQRIDAVEERIEVLEKQLEDEQRVIGQLTEMIFNFASRLSEVEQHQGVLRNIMARMSQKMEVLSNGTSTELDN